MIRPMKAETLRYGEWTRAGELVYDHPFQLGSRRIGPDLQRVGGKYPDSWHFEHMRDPRSTSPGSIMPTYPWLYEQDVDPDNVQASVDALATLGVPYDTAAAKTQLADQQKKIADGLSASGTKVEPQKEIVAVIAYLQRLGKDGKAAIAKSGGVL
jgi:cytochrome c oxidase cbb3-type subunit I/II